MRAVFFSDVSAATQALCAIPPDLRVGLSKQMIREADIADRFTRQLGKVHPVWGRGTLRETAVRHTRVVNQGFDDWKYCASMIQILKHLRLRPRLLHM